MTHAAKALTRYNTVSTVATPGSHFYETLCNFEDRMEENETVAVVNYGSNSPASLRETFREAKVSEVIRFGGRITLEGLEIRYGGRSSSRSGPVSTIDTIRGGRCPGWLCLVTKQQFVAIARRECGTSLGRDRTKGLYRRSVIWIPDPRDNGFTLMQAVAFVLRTDHPSVTEDGLATSSEVRRRLRIQRDTRHPFNTYTKQMDAQRVVSAELQAELFEGEQPLRGFWSSRTDVDI